MTNRDTVSARSAPWKGIMVLSLFGLGVALGFVAHWTLFPRSSAFDSQPPEQNPDEVRRANALNVSQYIYRDVNGNGRYDQAYRIEHELIATLGEVDGPGALTNVTNVAVDAHGRYWVFSDAVPAIFDDEGRFVRSLGRKGAGPGEFRSARKLWVIPGDSILIADGIRLHLFDPNLKFVRTIRSPVLGLRDMVIIDWPTNVIINAVDPRPGFIGQPFHVIQVSGNEGQVVKSFGETGETVTSSSIYYLMPHALTSASRRSGGAFWSIAAGIYDIVKWSKTHQRLATIERRPEWFKTRSDMGGGGVDTPPRPKCLGLHEDESGVLWTFCHVASPNFREAFERAADLLKRAQSAATDYIGIPSSYIDDDFLYYTWVEAIDARARRLVASYQLQDRVISVLPGRRAAVLTFSSSGVPYVHVYRFSIRTGPSH